MKLIVFISFLFLSGVSFAQCSLKGQIVDWQKNPVPFIGISIKGKAENHSIKKVRADGDGKFTITNLACGKYALSTFAPNYQSHHQEIEIGEGINQLTIEIRDSNELQTIDVVYESGFAMGRMHVIEGTTLTHGKKTEEIDFSKLDVNRSTNNARELYSSVPGLNIWESDGGGLQLGIGARGLSPSRTAHFNTRQNGYDISADALGYPETYYTPPSEAISAVQIIRGAASLQFGPQFGGMLNFKLREPSKKPIEYYGSQTYGSFNLINTFNSVSGTIGKRFSYLGYYQYKQGDGWRENAGFHQHHAFLKLKYHISDKMYVSAEQTYMSYLSQQPGGLTDAMFNDDPRQSIRSRNWFAVDWRILSAQWNWNISRSSIINAKFFKVDAVRSALGNLDKISRIDHMEERDLIHGDFNNIGGEIRLLQHYPLSKKLRGVLTGGLRFYKGTTQSQQGKANDGNGADFYFLNPTNLEGSDYKFPSLNASAFVENMFQLSDKLWLSAGLRYEFIRTQSEGFYREMIYHPLTEDLIFDSTYFESSAKDRSILLGGLGLTYRLDKTKEFYANIAQNYRGINFSDVRIVNPNQQVDPNITDERGFNTDLGLRGQSKSLVFDVSAFFLYYNNKIGAVYKKINDYEFVRWRTNVGKAFSTGIEAYVEKKFTFEAHEKLSLNLFANGSYIYARYGKHEEAAYNQKWIELVPPINLKAGIRMNVGKFRFNYLASYVHKQYSDGTNAEFDPNAIAGVIPAYYVMDLGAAYEINSHFTFRSGVNNLTNNKYFTRRATSYPGPGIIPSDGINFYTTLQIKL